MVKGRSKERRAAKEIKRRSEIFMECLTFRCATLQDGVKRQAGKQAP